MDIDDEFLRGQVPNLDAFLSSQNQPVFLGSEENTVDGAVNFGLSENLSFNQVPDNGLAVLSSRGEVDGLGGKIQAVDLTLVSDEGVLESHSLVAPDFDGLVVGGAHHKGLFRILIEFHTGDPVSVGILLNGELAFSNSIPDFQLFVTATAGDLSVVRGESHSQNISGVGNESSGGDSLLDIPESQGTVPRGREAVSAVL